MLFYINCAMNRAKHKRNRWYINLMNDVELLLLSTSLSFAIRAHCPYFSTHFLYLLCCIAVLR
jgi:hypothetical protein